MSANSMGNLEPGVLNYTSDKFNRFTHYLFKYPAKFHPPVARALIEKYSSPGDCIFDPFCGSGSILVEALATGRNGLGTDIDPVAVFVSRVKTRRIKVHDLERAYFRLDEALWKLERSAKEYERRQFEDISAAHLNVLSRHERLWIPKIPRLHHWFRNYVVVDLARILARIRRLRVPGTHRDALLLCFASIIRNSSNADPVPVSGLEVTSHMKAIDEAGRIINPYELFRKACALSLNGFSQLMESSTQEARVRVLQADATNLTSVIRTHVDVVITSPPYHNAVDYYRRHQLEMFWLDMVENQSQRLELLPKYIGRPQVQVGHPFVNSGVPLPPLAKEWHQRITQVSQKRGLAFLHYVVAMSKTFSELSAILVPRQRAVFVVGHSSWNSSEIPTVELFAELSQKTFVVDDYLSYPIKNRYMSYSRHNGADINSEHVVVFRRRNNAARHSSLSGNGSSR